MKLEYPDDGEYDLRVSPVTLEDYEKVSELFGEAVEKFRPTRIRALAEKFVEVAAPERDGQPVEIGKLDPNLILSLAAQWLKGVRDVPLPLPLRPSAGAPSAATPEG